MYCAPKLLQCLSDVAVAVQDVYDYSLKFQVVAFCVEMIIKDWMNVV